MPPVPSPKVMLVAVPPPVAPIVSVRPPSGEVPAVRVVVPAVRPSLARPVPLVTRSVAVPVCSVIAPAVIVEATAVPVIASIAVRDVRNASGGDVDIEGARSREPVVPPPLLKLMVVPLTTMVSAAVKSVVTESEFAPPDSKVAPVDGNRNGQAVVDDRAGVAAASVGAPTVPRRSSAVAPVIAAVETLDLVE